ncbi:uncharacterized protein STEHIDRAFT_65323, partial [Stereum hirsutum FP-91666 SS1]|uniref:uncharacterized protein n=1 Tax=Stereum hirsutum (strain FP-91666) TaxID=721885 RepID=UPI000444A931
QVSDKNGFATGGTSTVWTVQASDADLCFDPSQNILPPWPYFFMTPNPGLSAQSCETLTLLHSTPNFVGVIPSGDSFNITSTPTTDSDGTTGFNWTVPVKAGTDLLLVSGDQHETGAGGYVDYKVASPSDPTNTACFSFMPSATAGTPAGGNLPKSSSTLATSTPDK